MRNPEHFLSACLYLLIIAYFMIEASLAPYRNWDMVAYVGVVKQLATADHRQIYDATLAAIKEIMPPGQYYQTTVQNLLSNDAEIFWQQLPLYDIKPLYTLLLRALDAMGANTARATWLVANVFFGALCLTLAFWKPARAPYGLWLAAVLLLCQLGFLPMRSLAHVSTPDSLALFLLMASFIGWARFGSFATFAICGILSIAARPDSVMLVAGSSVFFTCFASRRIRMAEGVCMLAASMAAYAAIGAILPSFSWEKFFYYSYVHKLPAIAVNDVLLSWEQYRDVLARMWPRLWLLPRVQAMAAFSAVAMAAFAIRREAKEYAWLLAGLWLGFFVHFALVPSLEERYYYGFYLLMVLASLELAAPLYNRKGRTP